MGKLARGWLEAYKLMKTTRVGKLRQVENYVCGRAAVETILKKLIVAWETRNMELHGETGVSEVCKERLMLEVRELQALKDQARRRDAFVFIADVDKFLEKATVYSMTTYLAMTKKAILNSVKKWKKRYEEGVVSVTEWLRNVPGNEAFIKL